MIWHFFGLLFLFNGGFMLIAALVSFICKDGVTLEMALSGLMVLLLGIITMVATKNHTKELSKKDGYIVVALGWLIMSLSGTLPYLITESIPRFTDAFFETMSGYTTTGASILILRLYQKGYCFGEVLRIGLVGWELLFWLLLFYLYLVLGGCSCLLPKLLDLILINYTLELQIPQSDYG